MFSSCGNKYCWILFVEISIKVGSKSWQPHLVDISFSTLFDLFNSFFQNFDAANAI